jgi:uncharacterized damage-inducible protein DinB
MRLLLTTALVAGAAAWAQAPASGYRAEFLTEIDGFEKKFVSLAEQMPADKYKWQPGEGVRSVGQVFLHVASANFGLTRLIGAPPPASFQPKGYENSITDKAQIVGQVKESFAHLRQSVLKLSDTDAEKPVKLFGRETTTRAALLFIARHLGEHLGQSIAYARVNGVVPPWTEEAQRRQKKN